MSTTLLVRPPAKTTVSVRLATPDDAALIHRLTQACYAEYANTSAPSSVARETEASLYEALHDGDTRAAIAEHHEEPVGSVRFRREGDALYFFRLGVLPEARGSGVARELLAFVEQEARRRGAMRVRCSARASVPRNVRLYESSGFQRVGLQRAYRATTLLDLLIMEKPLHP